MNAKERAENTRELNEIATPKSERRWNANGMIGMSLALGEGFCPLPKCVRKANHDGQCWPTPKES